MPLPSSISNNKNAQIKAWKQTLIIDKRQIQSQNKDLPKLFPFTSTIQQSNELINKILKQYDQKQILIQKQQKKINKNLNELNTNINQLKQTLKYYQHTNEFLVKVQNLSEGIYGKIEKFKANMANQFQQLISAEEMIEKDLKLYDNKVQMIINGQYQYQGEGNYYNKAQQNQKNLGNKPPNNRLYSANKGQSTKNIKSTNNISSTKNIHSKQDQEQQNFIEMKKQQLLAIIDQIKIIQNQVQQIQSKIISLGKNLGWNQQDHNDFIKIWNRCQGKNYFQIQDQLIQYFKLYTEEQIRQHMNKYVKYKQLNEQKKIKIIQYKQQKQCKKIKQFQIASILDEKRFKQENKVKNNKKTQEQQNQMKQKLQQWKKIKENKKQQHQIKQKYQEENKLQQRKKRLQENNMKKYVIQKWKQQQQQIKTKKMKQSRQSKMNNRFIDKQTQQRIRQRQQRLIAQKVQFNMKKKIQQQQKILKQQKLKEQKLVKYSYVNSKLEEKTTAMKQKQREKFDGKNKKDANTFGGNLLHAGIRATPTWMQGL